MKNKRSHRRSTNDSIFSNEHADGFQVPDKIMEPHSPRQRSGLSRQYWYVKAKVSDANGNQKNALLGPYGSEEEAYNIGYAKVDGTFDVFSSPYSDRNRTTQQGKHGRMKNGDSLSKSLERWSHKL